MTLDLTGKHCPVIFSAVLFSFSGIMHANMQLFLKQPWWKMHASLILLIAKRKALFGKDAARKKSAFLHTIFTRISAAVVIKFFELDATKKFFLLI